MQEEPICDDCLMPFWENCVVGPESQERIVLGGRRLSILRLQSRFIFGNKRTNLIGHVQKFQPLLLI